MAIFVYHTIRKIIMKKINKNQIIECLVIISTIAIAIGMILTLFAFNLNNTNLAYISICIFNLGIFGDLGCLASTILK